MADLLLPFALIEDGILLQQDGSLVAAWSFRGPDMHSATHAEMNALAIRFNSILRLGSGWMVHSDLVRSKAPGYPEAGSFPHAVTRVIDDERRQQFMDEGAHFESEYFLALTYLPPVESEEKFKGWMFEGQSGAGSAVAKQVLDRFRSRVEMFENVFGSLFRIERLGRYELIDDCGFPQVHDRLLRYLRRCLTGQDHPFVLPDIPAYLNDTLAEQDFRGGIEPQIGDKHIRVLALEGFPKASFPGILGELDSLPMEYRWNTRAILLDPEDARAVLDKTRKKWKSRIRGFKDQVFRTQNGAVNFYAQHMADDAEQAMGVAASGDVQFAEYSTNIICLDEDLARLQENTRTVMKKIQNLGFSCRLETINAVEAWRGSLPGDGYRNVRRVLLHTLNIADLLPITSVWAGLRENPSRLMPRNSPPLLFAATTGATPFRVNLHVSDLGHTLMCGPSGAGKSTALGLIAAQWFRYPRAQVFAFDKGYSLFVLTKAADGEFYDLAGDGTDLAFCPLREIDSDADLTWAVSWLEDLCTLNGLAVTPKHRNAITQALLQLRLSPSRTLTELSANVQDLDVREALQFYTLSGPLGQLLDADEDVLSSGRFLTFETENLLQLDDKAVIPVLLYLFRRIEKRLDGAPTLVSLDEAWAYLRNAVFRERLRDWLKTLRRMNGIVLLATQNLSDICNSDISDVILEMCPTKILLPNGEAKNPASKEFYDRVGLNSRELDILQVSIPKQHYYVISPLGRRLISLGIHNVALSFVGVNGREERQQVEDLISEFPASWQSCWLRARAKLLKDERLAGWADYLDEVHDQLERKHQCARA
ncbi:MAG: conjugal transfer protein TrbE [Bryobacterales bacterium]|nr:conjugal transfer protein TrbE [Bryobacterales bacterium]